MITRLFVICIPFEYGPPGQHTQSNSYVVSAGNETCPAKAGSYTY